MELNKLIVGFLGCSFFGDFIQNFDIGTVDEILDLISKLAGIIFAIFGLVKFYYELKIKRHESREFSLDVAANISGGDIEKANNELIQSERGED